MLNMIRCTAHSSLRRVLVIVLSFVIISCMPKTSCWLHHVVHVCGFYKINGSSLELLCFKEISVAASLFGHLY